MFLQAFGHPLQPQTCDDDVALISLKRETKKTKKQKKKENKKETNTKKRKHKRKEIVMEN